MAEFAKIIVATHKKYDMPKDKIYLPVRVGAALADDDFGYQRDDEGENISKKNPYYCELTGLYWAWKNCNAKYIGLVHYRRHLGMKKTLATTPARRMKKVLNEAQLRLLLADNDIILPKKRNYYVVNLYAHYANTMYVEPLDELRKIIMSDYPEYYAEMRKLEKRKTAHIFNMFVMRKDILDGYCTWLFEILGKLEKKIDATEYNAFHARVFGRLSEWLLDVYIRTNKLKFVEVPVINIEGENFVKKGVGYVTSKALGRQYEKSY